MVECLSPKKHSIAKGGSHMRFYIKQHKYYCGIDLHTKKMYACILDGEGQIRLHQNIKTDPESLLRILTPFREDVVVAVGGMFTWLGSLTSVLNRTSPSS